MDATTVWDLPDDVLITIFSYLPFWDQRIARLVCKHWYAICESPCLTKDNVISIWYDELDAFAMNRRNFNLRIKFFDEPLKEVSFWKNFGSEVRTLELLSGYLWNPIFNFIFSYCENLQSLSISRRCHRIDTFNSSSSPAFYNDCIFKDLNLLSSLYLSGLYTIDREYFEKLTKHAPNLTQFGLVNPCFVEKDVEQGLNAAVVEMVRRQSSKLVKLDFTACRLLNDKAFESILKVIGPQLAELNLNWCNLRGNSSLIANRIPNLINIYLNCTSFRTEDYCTIFKSLKKLKIVSLASTPIDDNVLFSIFDLEDLEELVISSCRLLTLNGMMKVFTRRLLQKMRKLFLNCIECIYSDNVFKDIFPIYIPNLNVVQIELHKIYERDYECY